MTLRTKIVWLVRLFASGSLLAGVVAAGEAGSVPRTVENTLIIGGGTLLGFGVVLLLGGPRFGSDNQILGIRGPTPGQGCLISLGGSLLAAFSCVRLLDPPYTRDATAQRRRSWSPAS